MFLCFPHRDFPNTFGFVAQKAWRHNTALRPRHRRPTTPRATSTSHPHLVPGGAPLSRVCPTGRPVRAPRQPAATPRYSFVGRLTSQDQGREQARSAHTLATFVSHATALTSIGAPARAVRPCGQLAAGRLSSERTACAARRPAPAPAGPRL